MGRPNWEAPLQMVPRLMCYLEMLPLKGHKESAVTSWWIHSCLISHTPPPNRRPGRRETNSSCYFSNLFYLYKRNRGKQVWPKMSATIGAGTDWFWELGKQSWCLRRVAKTQVLEALSTPSQEAGIGRISRHLTKGCTHRNYHAKHLPVNSSSLASGSPC